MKHLSITLLAALTLSACIGPKLKVEPVTVNPIHLTIDVNLRDPADAAPAAAPEPAAR